MNYSKDELLEILFSYHTEYSMAELLSKSKKELIALLAIEEKKRNPSLLPQIAVMSIHEITRQKEELTQEILYSPDWIGEEKIDGCRIKVHILEDGSIRIDSKHPSVRNFCYTEKTVNFPHLTTYTFPKLANSVLDGEIVVPTSPKAQGVGTLNSTVAVFNSLPERAWYLQEIFGKALIYLFDVIHYQGNAVIDLPFIERRELLQNAFNLLKKKSPYFLITQLFEDQKIEHLKDIWDNGGEGMVFKYKQGLYLPGKRTKTQFKWKRKISVDGFIKGFMYGEGKYDGMIGSLVVAGYDQNGKERTFARVPPGSDKMRAELSTSGGELKKKYYDKVIEVSGQDWTRTRRLRHPVLIRWREDKTKEECILPF